MKKIAFLLLSVFLISSIGVCFAKNAKRKLNKPVFVAGDSDKDSSIYKIKAMDNYDNTFFYSYNRILNEWGNVIVEYHTTNPKDSIIDKVGYGGVFDEKFVFSHIGYEDSDTLFGRRIELHYGLNTQIMLNNEGSVLKIFGKKYGKSVSILTPAKKVIAEKDINNGVTEFNLPQTPEYVYVDIKCEEADNIAKHFIFKYPMR